MSTYTYGNVNVKHKLNICKNVENTCKKLINESGLRIMCK